MFNIKNISKKLLICGASLMMMSSLANGTVSAKHVHHSHTRITRIGAINSNKPKYLSFNKLLNTMSYDYHLYSTTGHKNYKNALKIQNKLYYPIFNTIKHNFKHYSDTQLEQLSNNPDSKVLDYTSDYDLHDYIKNLDLSKTNHVNELSQQDNEFDTEIRNYLVNDINQTRVSYGRKPLIITNVMQQVANYRDPKVQYAYDHLSDYINYPHNTSNPYDNWVHGKDTHTTGYEYLENHGYSHNWGANAGNWGAKYTENGDRTPIKYPNDTPEHIAENIDDGIINHDNCEGNYNGHRKNELNPNWKYLGVGITYDPQTQQGTFNEQFAGDEQFED